MEKLEPRQLLAGLPYGAHEQDTAEYMLGDVLVTVVLFESNGSVDSNTENWNLLQRDQDGDVIFDDDGRTISVSGPNAIEQAKDKVREGMQWWEDTLDDLETWWYEGNPTPPDIVHSLNFKFDFTHTHNPISTGYEPISRPSDDYDKWVGDFLKSVGHDTFASLDVDIRSFNNAQRMSHDTDWAFTIFVINDQNDPDRKFALNGTFLQAFAFPGGQFTVVPFNREGKIHAHESGHIFWSRDEYKSSGATYTQRRGYYNNQNLNAWDNPSGHQVDSIMDSFERLDRAYAANISSRSSLEMLGWRDTDANGVFDVLDVPLSFEGSGYYEPSSGNYRFVGRSKTQTLPNLNSSGLHNDITLNEVTRAEYRIDGGAWQTAAVYNAWSADLDLLIPLQPGEQIEIRTVSIDSGEGTEKIVSTSAGQFIGNTTQRTSVVMPGINGFAWHDEDQDGNWTPGEVGLSGWQIRLVDDAGQPIQLQDGVEPDDYDSSQTINTVNPAVTLSGVGFGVKDDRVSVGAHGTSSTGTKVFTNVRPGVLGVDSWTPDWTESSRTLRMDFTTPTTTVSIDAVARNRDSYGRLEAYDSAGNLLGRYSTKLITGNESETMTISRPTAEIAYAIARGHLSTSVRLDNLRFGPAAQTTTDALGAYSLSYLEPNTYHVQAIPPAQWSVTSPDTGIHDVDLISGSVANIDFGGELQDSDAPWQNPNNRLDVNADTLVTPQDALIVINDLNANSSRPLPPPGADGPPPYLDVNGDGFVTPVDALLIINFLNSQVGGEDGRFGGGGGGGVGGGAGNGDGEGEAVRPTTLDEALFQPRIVLDGQPTDTGISATTRDAETAWPDPLVWSNLALAGGPLLEERWHSWEPVATEPGESRLVGLLPRDESATADERPERPVAPTELGQDAGVEQAPRKDASPYDNVWERILDDLAREVRENWENGDLVEPDVDPESEAQ